MKLIQFALLVFLVAVTSADLQKGLRAVVFFTYDESFTGADLVAQELTSSVLEKLLANKDLVSKPKPLQSSFEFLSLLDSRCDIQLKCEKKECKAAVEKTCPAAVPCQKCEVTPCGKTAPPSPPPPKTTPAPPTPPKTTPARPKTTPTPPKTSPPPPILRTTPKPLCANGAPDSASPDCCKNAGGKGKYCCTNGLETPDCQSNTYLPPPPTVPTSALRSTAPPTKPTERPKNPLCKNGAPDSAFPDCCKNGAKGKNCCVSGPDVPGCVQKKSEEINPPKCKNGAPDSAFPDCCKNPGEKGKFCCKNGATNAECIAPTTRAPTTRAPTTTKFRGPSYIPQSTIVPQTTNQPWTGTYVINTGTFRQSHTWEPIRSSGTWSPRPTRSRPPITTTPKYATKFPLDGPIPLEFQYPQ